MEARCNHPPAILCLIGDVVIYVTVPYPENPVSLDEMLPLPPHLFHVLLALRAAPLHGYAIKKAVSERSEGRIALDAGGLYRLIARLVDSGAIEEAAAPRGAVRDDRTRIYYRLTRAGERLVALEARRLAALVASPDVRALLREVKG
jgi:DNA-binding PadR family transcriptional regulator